MIYSSTLLSSVAGSVYFFVGQLYECKQRGEKFTLSTTMRVIGGTICGGIIYGTIGAIFGISYDLAKVIFGNGLELIFSTMAHGENSVFVKFFKLFGTFYYVSKMLYDCRNEKTSIANKLCDVGFLCKLLFESSRGYFVYGLFGSILYALFGTTTYDLCCAITNTK